MMRKFTQVNETESPSEDMKIIASEAILLLVVDIRQCVKAQKRLLNESTRKSVLSQLQTFENYSTEILNVLKNWIVLAGNSSKKVKINLFACFLTFLHFCTDRDEPEVEYWLENIKQESDEIDYNSINSTQMFRVKLLNSDYKDQLLKIFCEDATAAHDIWKVSIGWSELMK